MPLGGWNCNSSFNTLEVNSNHILLYDFTSQKTIQYTFCNKLKKTLTIVLLTISRNWVNAVSSSDGNYYFSFVKTIARLTMSNLESFLPFTKPNDKRNNDLSSTNFGKILRKVSFRCMIICVHMMRFQVCTIIVFNWLYPEGPYFYFSLITVLLIYITGMNNSVTSF